MPMSDERRENCQACLAEIFEDLSDDDLERLQNAAHIIQRPKGHLIYDEGDSAVEGYCICAGTVEVFKRIQQGGALVLGTAHAGAILGMEEILAEHGTYHTSARALFDVQLVGLPREEILGLAQSSSDFARLVAEWLSRDLSRTREELTSIVEKPLYVRLKEKLYELAREYGTPTDGWMEIGMPLTNDELAQMIGTTSGTVSMLLHDLKEEGVVTRKGRTFFVRDAQRQLQHAS